MKNSWSASRFIAAHSDFIDGIVATQEVVLYWINGIKQMDNDILS